MKKYFALTLALCMIFALCACGQQTPAPEEKPAGKTVLNLWCTATESDANHEAYVKAIDAFNASHSDVEIVWEAYENESYKTKIKASAAAGQLPDIFFTWSGDFLGDFVKSGKTYCLDDVFPAYKNQLPEAMLDNSTYEGGHYAVPLKIDVGTLFANMDLLKQAGYDKIPETYEEFCACCDALKAKGIIPIGCSAKEPWCIAQFLEPVIIKTIGTDALSDVYRQKATWNNEGIAKAVDAMQDMIKKGYFDPDGIALSNDEVKANFNAGRYAFYPNGSWNCGDCYDPEHPDKVQAGVFPVVDSTCASLYMFNGGPNDAFAVSAYSKNAKAAAEAVFELARDISRYVTLIGSGIPSWTPDYDTSSINPLAASVTEMVAGSKGMVLFGDNAQGANNANIYLDYVSRAYDGAIDGKEFIAGLSADIG